MIDDYRRYNPYRDTSLLQRGVVAVCVSGQCLLFELMRCGQTRIHTGADEERARQSH